MCLFNNKGEDRSYFSDLYNIQETKKGGKGGKPGKHLVTFLNHWSMRLDTDLAITAIDKWYTDEGAEKLTSLQKSLQNTLTLAEADLNDGKVIGTINELYCGLDKISGIADTSASKILHLLMPELFVMWDNPIREHYMGDCKGSGAYILFLKKMQEISKCLRNQNSNIFRDLFITLKDPLKKNLINVISKNESKRDIINFVNEIEKTITMVDDKCIDAKFIDEYNWVVFTKKCKMPPIWHSSDRIA